MRTEAQRRAHNKYNAKNYKTAGVKLTISEFETLQAAATAEGLTVNALLKRLAFNYIAAKTEQPEN